MGMKNGNLGFRMQLLKIYSALKDKKNPQKLFSFVYFSPEKRYVFLGPICVISMIVPIGIKDTGMEF